MLWPAWMLHAAARERLCDGWRDIAGHWEALQLLAQYPQLPALKALQGMLPRLAEQGQFLVLACAFAQVCLLD